MVYVHLRSGSGPRKEGVLLALSVSRALARTFAFGAAFFSLPPHRLNTRVVSLVLVYVHLRWSLLNGLLALVPRFILSNDHSSRPHGHSVCLAIRMFMSTPTFTLDCWGFLPVPSTSPREAYAALSVSILCMYVSECMYT